MSTEDLRNAMADVAEAMEELRRRRERLKAVLDAKPRREVQDVPHHREPAVRPP